MKPGLNRREFIYLLSLGLAGCTPAGQAVITTLAPTQKASQTPIPTATSTPLPTSTPQPTATEAPTPSETPRKVRLLPDLARRKGVDIAIFLTPWDVLYVQPGREKARETGLEIGTRLQLSADALRAGRLFKNFNWDFVLAEWDQIQPALAEGTIPNDIRSRIDLKPIGWVDELIDFAVANGLDPDVSIGNLIGSAGDKFTDMGLLETSFTVEDYWKILEFITRTKTLLVTGVNQARARAGKAGRLTELTAVAEACKVTGTPLVNSGFYALLTGKDPNKVADGSASISYDTVRQVVNSVFGWAREADPQETISLTLAEDYLWCMSNDNDRDVFKENWAYFLDLLSDCRKDGAPIANVKEEGTGWAYAVPDYEFVRARMQQIVDMGVGIANAEYTCAVNDVFPGWKNRPKVNPGVEPLQAQAEYFTSILRAHVEVAGGRGFGTFGPMAMGENSYPEGLDYPDANAHFFDAQGNPNPAYYAVIDYLETLPDKPAGG
ncbi:MAG: hypothetical protein JXB15_17070 [Anaerolineales bacterium]|nr:hypothetical protein [Anaerolineales bacterium]